MLKTDDHLYTLTRLEFAKSIGKSKNAVKLGMMRGKYKDQYIFKNGKYFFKSEEGKRENHDVNPGDLNPVKSSTKRIIRRGNHDKPGAYTSSTMKRVPHAFKVRNDMVRLMSAKGKIKPEDQRYIPILEKKTEQWLREEKQKSLKDHSVVSLGGSLRGSLNKDRSEGVNIKRHYGGLYSVGSNKGYGTPGYFGGNHTDNRSYTTTNRGRTTFKKGPYEI
jgi:hypothetical protein